MFENIIKFFKKANKKQSLNSNSKDTAKERLHLVLMQDRANVSADFLDLMRQEIIEVIKKYIDIDEAAMDVRLTNQENEDGTQGAPALYANIPIVNIKEKARNAKKEIEKEEEKTEDKIEEKTEKNKNGKEEHGEHEQHRNYEHEKTKIKDDDQEVKILEEKAKKIVKEENSLHHTNNEDIEIHNITNNEEKKESEDE